MQPKTARKSSRRLKARQQEANTALSLDVLLTPQQLSKRWNITALTLRRYRDQGKLRAVLISSRIIRFPMSEVLRVEAEAFE